MRLLRFKLKPSSPWRTPWQSDTLSGTLCWMAARRYGAARLTDEILSPALAGNPPFALSDAFPGELLPVPMTVRLSPWPASDAKRARNATWVRREIFQAIQRGERPDGDSLLPDDAVIAYGQMRNTLDRATETTSGDGGNLFQVAERALNVTHSCLAGADFLSIYAAVAEKFVPTLNELFQELASVGFGADASVGRGHFEVPDEPEDASWLAANVGAGGGLVVLSTFQPAPSDPTEGFWDSFVKYGKLGADFGLENVFKRPLVMFRPGACFAGDATRRFLGRAIPMNEMLSDETAALLTERGANIVHLAFGLTAPMQFPPELTK